MCGGWGEGGRGEWGGGGGREGGERRGVGESRQFPGAGSSRSVAGQQDVLDESCGCGVEELVPDFDDTPGTTGGTKFYVLQRIIFPCLVNRDF